MNQRVAVNGVPERDRLMRSRGVREDPASGFTWMHYLGVVLVVLFLLVSVIRLGTDSPGRMARQTRSKFRADANPVVEIVDGLRNAPEPAYAGGAEHP
jgi:hypothetical protein